jgi:hypothetical protein
MALIMMTMIRRVLKKTTIATTVKMMIISLFRKGNFQALVCTRLRKTVAFLESEQLAQRENQVLRLS